MTFSVKSMRKQFVLPNCANNGLNVESDAFYSLCQMLTMCSTLCVCEIKTVTVHLNHLVEQIGTVELTV